MRGILGAKLKVGCMIYNQIYTGPQGPQLMVKIYTHLSSPLRPPHSFSSTLNLYISWLNSPFHGDLSPPSTERLHINKETGFDLLTENHGPRKVPGHFQGVVVPTLRMKLQT